MMFQGIKALKHVVADAVDTLEIFSMPKEDRIKLWIKHTVIYEFDHHKTYIDTSYLKPSRDNSLIYYYSECVSEVERLRNDKIDTNFTLLDFVTKGYAHISESIDEEFMNVCLTKCRIAERGMYPIYGDMVYDKAMATFLNLSKGDEELWRCLYRSEWDDIFQSNIVMLRIGRCRSVTLINNNTGVGEFCLLENAFPNWEKLKDHYVDGAKRLFKNIIFHFSDTQDFLTIMNLNQYKDLTCYPFLLSYHNACLSEIKVMREDNISQFQTLHAFLDSFELDEEAMSSTDALRDERIFNSLLSCKYKIYRDDIAVRIKMPFLNDTMVGLCISIEVSDNSSKNGACSEGLKQLILVPHVTHKVCEYLPQTDLLNLTLAFSAAYNKPNLVENLHPSLKRKSNVPNVPGKRLTFYKKYLYCKNSLKSFP